MKKCPYCAEQIQDDAVKCRFCGEFLDGRQRQAQQVLAAVPVMQAAFYGYEYKSSLNILGLPLVHIAQGIDPQTMRPRVAKGIIAIGNIAIGVLALGGASFGGICLGGFSLGVLAFGGCALGAVAIGGAAFGVTAAVGGLAIAGKIAIGGLAIAPHTIGSTGVDPEAVRILKQWFPSLARMFPPGYR